MKSFSLKMLTRFYQSHIFYTFINNKHFNVRRQFL
ncbi:hypothetical protein, partial [Plasmodium yoelii yoelii]